MDALMAALGDGHRRAVIERLREGPATAGELAELMPIARPGASRHLRLLRDAGLVTVQAQGQRRLYSLDPEPLQELDRWLASFRDVWLHRLDALGTEIARGSRTPGPTRDLDTEEAS